MRLPNHLRFNDDENVGAAETAAREPQTPAIPTIRKTGEVAVRFGCEGCVFGKTITYPTVGGELSIPSGTSYPMQVSVEQRVVVEGPFSASIPAGRYTVYVGGDECRPEPLSCLHADDIVAAANRFSANPKILERQIMPQVEEIPLSIVHETPASS